MSVNRRRLLGGLGSMAAASRLAANGPDSDDPAGLAGFPRKHEFAIPAGHTYINGAYIHPMPVATAENVRRYTLSRSQPDGATSERIDIKAEFAALLAEPDRDPDPSAHDY
jgi:hypothetical protein